MQPILAFVDVPPLLRDLVARLLEPRVAVRVHPDVLDPGDLSRATAAAHIGVLVAGSREPISDLVASNPRLKVIVLLDQGRHAAVYQPRPVIELCELSTDRLVGVIEAASRGIGSPG